MKRIAITLVLSIVVFVVTLVTTDTCVSRRSVEAADYINSKSLDSFQAEMNDNILMVELAAGSFLSGITYVSVSDSEEIVLEESHLPKFIKHSYDNLEQFLRSNRYYAECMFIIDDEINREYFGQDVYYTPMMMQGDTTRIDLAKSYNYVASANYQSVKKTRKKLWALPSPDSPVFGKLVNFYMPILLSNGRFLGAFVISLSVDMINDKLKRHLPYDEEHSAIFIADENNNIFAGYPGWIMDYKEDFKANRLNLKYEEKSADYIRYQYEENDNYVFSRKTSNAPWTIYTLSATEKVYEKTNQLKAVVFGTSLLGMILMFLCCFVISRQIRKDLRKKAAVEDELNMAAKVQMKMLRTPQPSLEGGMALNAYLKPARKAGGDLYDYIEKNGKLIFCIGDVSGKGMPAALFMTQVVSLFRNAVQWSDDPAAIVSQINNVLALNNPDMTFCTFFVGVLEGGELRFCNAGHNPPVLLSNAGSSFMKVRPNLALGLMTDYPYKAEVVNLAKGDSLLLYTDGITEAKNCRHEDFGESRLLESLSPLSSDNCSLFSVHCSLDNVLTAVHTFVDDYEQSDDITLVVVS